MILSTSAPSSVARALRFAPQQFRNFSATTAVCAASHKCQVLVLGCGSGGCAVAAQLTRRLGRDTVTVLEPAEHHYYQPMFTMIGGGMNRLQDARRPMADVIPSGVRWLRDAADRIEPLANRVHTAAGDTIEYETLLIAVGLRLNYERVAGLHDALQVPDGNVTSIYSPAYVERHYAALQRYRDGPLLFTFPQPPVKCPGAPQKIAYISEHYLRREGKRSGAQLAYISALPVIFGVPYFAAALTPIAKSRDIEVLLQHHLVEVRGAENRAVFESTERPGERVEREYALLHVTPPQEAPQVLRDSIASGDGLVNAGGFVDVDEQTMRHRRFENVWALGDCTATPNSKTMAAAAAQSGIVTDNILAVRAGRQPTGAYDGYAACPLVTGYDTCVMAEFDYRLQPLETFPVRQNCERRTMFWMKKYAMPTIYWQAMVRGWWRGPAAVRRALSMLRWGRGGS